MLPGKTATKKAAVVAPTTARAGCFHVPSRAAPRASSTTPETTTTESGSAGNHVGTWAWNSWRCFVRCPVPAVSSAAPSASCMAPWAQRFVDLAAIRSSRPPHHDRPPALGILEAAGATGARRSGEERTGGPPERGVPDRTGGRPPTEDPGGGGHPGGGPGDPHPQ